MYICGYREEKFGGRKIEDAYRLGVPSLQTTDWWIPPVRSAAAVD